MKMKILPTFLVIIVCVVSCDKNPLLYRHKSVRARIKLEKIEIKSLNETVYFTGGEKPRLWEFGEEKYYVIGYRYRWDESSNNFIIINLTVAGAVELAYEYLNNKRLNCSCPIVCLPSEDHPAIAGDISFGGGRHFIRNNIVIEM